MIVTGQTATADPGSIATITIDGAHPAGRLPADFVGPSFEMRELGIGNLGPGKGNVASMFRTLGRSNIRISGNTLDRDTLWVPRGHKFQRYTPFCAANKADEAAQLYQAMPIYYGLWLARWLGPGTFLPLTLSTDRNGHLQPHHPDQVRVRDGSVSLDLPAGSAALITVDTSPWR